MKPVPHGEPYAGKLHVRFDEGYPPKNGEARFEGSRRPSGRTLRGRPALLYTLGALRHSPASVLARGKNRGDARRVSVEKTVESP